MLDYELLRIIWWVLLGVLLIGFAVTDGFDLGVGILLPWVARKDAERRVTLNTVGPVWEGNQGWIILGAGAIFAAWPIIYAVSFSGFYLAMFLALTGFILRPVGFKYRSKIQDPRWRQVWDIALFLGGFIPALIFGVAIGNVLQGVPFHFNENLRDFYTGSFFGLLNPFALVCGLVSVMMLTMHGGLFLAVKTEGIIRERAITSSRIAAVMTIALFAIAGVWIAYGIDGYEVTKAINMAGPSNPLHKPIVKELGAWISNYEHYRWTLLAPICGFIGAIVAFVFARIGHGKIAFFFSGLSIFGIISTVGVSMFPVILPSSSNPSASLLVWDASSSQLTLFVMLIATVIFLPIILFYTTWVYRVMRGKVTVDTVRADSQSY